MYENGDQGADEEARRSDTRDAQVVLRRGSPSREKRESKTRECISCFAVRMLRRGGEAVLRLV